ncbi:N-formylglutamate amidohydrolase [Bacteroidota bacterium]
MKAPILISIPHGGWKVADEIKDIWALSKKDAFHDGDPFTCKIYDFSDKVEFQIVMEYYRAVIDLNRQPDDIAPQNPDGVIKSHTCWNVPVYKKETLPDEMLKKILLDKYYFPYHKQMEEQIKNPAIKLAVDCHSMSATSPPIEADAGAVRPLICLGNLGDENGEIESVFNRITCDPELIKFMADEFRLVFQYEDLEVVPPAIATTNVPFSGGNITRLYGGQGVPFVQIEMSRALYLSKDYFDETNFTVKESRLKDLNEKIWKVLSNTLKNL